MQSPAGRHQHTTSPPRVPWPRLTLPLPSSAVLDGAPHDAASANGRTADGTAILTVGEDRALRVHDLSATPPV
jgi:hypothetical protein